MTVARIDRAGPWTEEEYLALDQTSERVELFDGSLHMTPAPTLRHQNISAELWLTLRSAARAVGLRALEAINVRLRDARLVIPDVVVIDDVGLDRLVVDAPSVHLIAEITSASNAAADKVFKMHCYAAAKIDWYLIVEQDTKNLRLYRLRGVSYVEHAVVRPGEVLRLTEPVAVDIRPEDLHT
ncbi:Uma2 family endonuclease [Polymorphospora sp. NPDC051019]|uniref:Uma2 family endonuclease n=1 Tax=Polymorphospora sp. NPDC051019 TaxID=3155725 RepID=UPI00343C466D